MCSELCGKDHAFMPIVVEVMEADDYAQWVATQLSASAVKTSMHVENK